jgi:hypothetical protein
MSVRHGCAMIINKKTINSANDQEIVPILLMGICKFHSTVKRRLMCMAYH